MNGEVFSQRLNQELSLQGYPSDSTEKATAISIVFGIPRRLANTIICGHQVPPQEQLHKIAKMLDVCPKWLNGTKERRTAYPRETV